MTAFRGWDWGWVVGGALGDKEFDVEGRVSRESAYVVRAIVDSCIVINGTKNGPSANCGASCSSGGERCGEIGEDVIRGVATGLRWWCVSSVC